MKNKILTLIAIGMLSLTASVRAQDTNAPAITNAPVLGEPFQKVLGFLSQGSNWMVAPYGIYNSGGAKFADKVGAGVALAYKLSDFVVPTMRLDYLSGQLWMPSASLQLQIPVTIGSVTAIPFLFGGIATPVSGTGKDNLTAQSIIGVGAAVRISTHFDLVADYEKWSAVSGQQLRFGFLYKF